MTDIYLYIYTFITEKCIHMKVNILISLLLNDKYCEDFDIEKHANVILYVLASYVYLFLYFINFCFFIQCSMVSFHINKLELHHYFNDCVIVYHMKSSILSSLLP